MKFKLEMLEDRCVPAQIPIIAPHDATRTRTDIQLVGVNNATFVPEAQEEAALDGFTLDTTNPLSPTLVSTLTGQDYTSYGTPTGNVTSRPDMDIAVGPNHVVTVVQNTIWWSNKDGTGVVNKQLGPGALGIAGAFFDLPGTAEDPTGGLSWAQVSYDTYASRFVVEGTRFVAPSPNCFTWIGVSNTSDPNGGWTLQRFDTNLLIDGINTRSNVTRMSVDPSAIYLVSNYYNDAGTTYKGPQLFIIPKGIGTGGIYDVGGTSVATAYDPVLSSGLTAADRTSSAPSEMIGVVPTGKGIYLTMGYFTSPTNIFLSVIEVNDPVGTPTFVNSFVSFPLYDDFAVALPAQAQPTTTNTLSILDRRLTSAVWRNNRLYVSGQLLGNSNAGADLNQVTVTWFETDTTLLPATNFPPPDGDIAGFDSGLVGAEDLGAGTWTVNPGLVVDSVGNMGVAFSAGNATSVFPGAYYAARYVGDPLSTIQSTGTIAAGIQQYTRTFTDGGTVSQWSLYGGAASDPSDDSMWVMAEQSDSAGDPRNTPVQNGRWSTKMGKFFAKGPTVLDVLDVAPDPRATAVSSIDVTFDHPINLATFTVADLTLTLNAGPPIVFSGNETFTLVSGSTYTVGGLAEETATDGTYLFTVTGAGINDLSGNAGLASASDSWVKASGDTTSPTVTGLFIDGSAWTTAFRTAAGNATFGYPAQTGAGQLTTMPWSTVNRFIITFSEPVNPLTVAQVGVRGVNVASYTVASITTLSATDYQINLAAPVDTDWFILDIDGSAATGVKDIALNALAGTFTENVSTFPTTGAGGVNFKYRFKITVGDADRNNLVRNADKNLVTANLFVDAGFAGYNIYADTNADGLVRNVDKNIVNAHLFVDGPTGGGPSRPRGGAAGGNGTTSNTGRVGRFTNGTAVGNDRTGSATRRLGSNLAVSAIDELFAQV